MRGGGIEDPLGVISLLAGSMLGETNLENIESGLVTIIRFLRSQPSVEYLIWFFNILRDPKRGGGYMHKINPDYIK